MERLSWVEYFSLQAVIASSRSTCERAYVGAVIVKNKRVIATGYNGSVHSDDHCIDVGHHLIDGHCVRTVHAEVNAITQCAKYGIETDDSELFVTHFPCLNCTKSLIQAGIRKVNYLNDYRVDEYAKELLTKANIELNKVELKESYLKINNVVDELLQ